MTKTKFLASLAICAALATGTALARDNDHDRGKAGSGTHNIVADRDHDRDRARDYWRDHRREHERLAARERERRNHHAQNAMLGHNGPPRGWSEGRKTGWRNCDVPPAQAKKAGCTPAVTHRARPVHTGDRDHDGDRR